MNESTSICPIKNTAFSLKLKNIIITSFKKNLYKFLGIPTKSLSKYKLIPSSI